MKKILFVLFLLSSLLAVEGKVRTQQEMETIAKSVFANLNIAYKHALIPGKGLSVPLIVVARSKDVLADQQLLVGQESFQVYALGNGMPGFVIVSADTRLPEVLAYSDAGVFSVQNLPSELKTLLSAYANSSYAQPNLPVDLSSEVEPLLGAIAYSQRTPYNDLCPIWNDKHSAAGCVATAMAQVMKFYKYPVQMQGEKISYVTERNGITVNWDCSSTQFEWENILDTYTELVPPYAGDESIISTQYMVLTCMKASSRYQGYMEICNLANVASGQLNGFVQFILTDANGNFIRPVGEKKEISLNQGYYYQTYYLKHSVPSDIADGTYRLYLGYQPKGSSTWALAKAVPDINHKDQRSNYFLAVVKSGLHYIVADETFSCGYSDVEGNAVATLCAACGASVGMDYGTDGSSASSMMSGIALYDYMGYDSSISFARKPYFTAESWELMMQQELQNGRPILASGTTAKGSGHAFIIDGYTSNSSATYYHVNWGWNGDCNGYFLLNNLTPDPSRTGVYSNNYGYSLSLVTGIQPATGVDSGYAFGMEEFTASLDGNDVVLKSTKLGNRSVKTFSGDFLAYIIADNRAEIPIGVFLSYENLKTGSYFKEYSKKLPLPLSLQTGTYKIVLRAKASGAVVERDVMVPEWPVIKLENPLEPEDGLVKPTSDLKPSVQPLLKTVWGQRTGGVNSLTPTYIDSTGQTKHYPAGCGATAMAQVMKYYNYPEHGYGSNFYCTSEFSGRQLLTADFEHTYYNWDAMADNYINGQDLTDENVFSVAQLMFHCGVAVDMVYGANDNTNSSGAALENVCAALKCYFGYNKNMYIARVENYGYEAFILLMMKEISEGRPVFVRGAYIDENGKENGHFYVADGYDADGRIHLNLGGSSFNGNPNIGYFNMKDTSTYTDGLRMIVGLTPETLEIPQTTLAVTQPGTLESLLANHGQVHNLKLKGSLNSDDFTCIRNLCKVKGGELMALDLSEVLLSDDELPNSALSSCVTLNWLTLPQRLKTINRSALQGSRNLLKMEIPGTVSDIEAYAFYLCKCLKEIEIPRSVKRMDSYAFSGCRVDRFKLDNDNSNFSLRDGAIYNLAGSRLRHFPSGRLGIVVVPDGAQIIDVSAFSNCEGIEELYLPASLNQVNNYAFPYMYSLKHIYCGAAIPPVTADNALEKINMNCLLHVPFGCKEAYEQSAWGKFSIVDDLTSILEIVEESHPRPEVKGYYDLQGREYRQRPEGLHIVLYTDGSSHMVLSK